MSARRLSTCRLALIRQHQHHSHLIVFILFCEASLLSGKRPPCANPCRIRHGCHLSSGIMIACVGFTLDAEHGPHAATQGLMLEVLLDLRGARELRSRLRLLCAIHVMPRMPLPSPVLLFFAVVNPDMHIKWKTRLSGARLLARQDTKTLMHSSASPDNVSFLSFLFCPPLDLPSAASWQSPEFAGLASRPRNRPKTTLGLALDGNEIIGLAPYGAAGTSLPPPSLESERQQAPQGTSSQALGYHIHCSIYDIRPA